MGININGSCLTESGHCYFNGNEVNKIVCNGTTVWKRCYSLIPAMSSNSESFGNAYCSSKYNNNTDAYKAFDEDLSTNWLNASGITSQSAIQSEFLFFYFSSGKEVYLDHIGFVGISTAASFKSSYDVTIYIRLYNASGDIVKQIEYPWDDAMKYDEVIIHCDARNVNRVDISFSNRMRNGSDVTSHYYVSCARLRLYGHD